MKLTAKWRRLRGSFLTVELVLSIGLAAVAFGSFLGLYHSVRKQQLRLEHYAAATFLLQSTIEEIRLGEQGKALSELTWAKSEQGGLTSWQTSPVKLDTGFSWWLTATNQPDSGQAFYFQTIVSWKERGRTKRAERVSAATQLFLK